MTFTKRLREGIRRGEITCSVRFWMGPGVRVGGRYPTEEGEIEVDSIEMIGFPDITPQLARESGFFGRVGLAEGGEAWERGEDLPGAVPLCEKEEIGKEKREIGEGEIEIVSWSCVALKASQGSSLRSE